MGESQTLNLAPGGRGILKSEPPNSPGPRGMSRSPNRMDCSLSRLSVQKGRSKSWLSTCGGMQSSCSGKQQQFPLQLLRHAAVRNRATIKAASGQNGDASNSAPRHSSLLHGAI